MILRLVFCVYFINLVRAAEWQPQSYMGVAPHPPISDTNADQTNRKPDFNIAFNTFYNSNAQVPSKHGPLLEISQNTKCYTTKSMMNMVRGILGYLAENPNKINYLHHLINFLNDEDERASGDSNQFGEIARRIEVDDSLPSQEKKLLRELLHIDIPESGMQTMIVFKYELPSLNQPQCKDVFVDLMELARERYTQLVRYPECHIPGYDHSNNGQPEIPEGYFPGWPEQPSGFKPGENWPPIFPDVPIPFPVITTPRNLQVETSPAPTVPDYWNPIPSPPNGEVSMDKIIKYLIFIITQTNDNSHQNSEIIEKLLALIKLYEHEISYSHILALIEILQHSNASHKTSKLIEIILQLLVNIKTAPDPRVIQIIIRRLKPKSNGVVNPKIFELMLALLKANKDDVAKYRFEILLPLLTPNENGEVNPKLIEIINYLLQAKESSPPNNKIIKILVTFLNVGLNSGLNSKNIDTLLNLLKLNNNHKLPEPLYHKIIQFLLKINVNKNPSNSKKVYIYYPLLPFLIAKNPKLFDKWVPNRFATMPNQLNPNVPGVIELTYLLKHPKPFVYQPSYYVKYKLPLPTFVTNVKNLLQKDPLLKSNPAKLYQDLIKISNVTEISPNLKGYSMEDILKLTSNSGALIKTKILDDKNVNFKEEIALVQNMNSDVQPESILEQSDHMLTDQEFKDETHKLDQFWKIMQPDNVYSPVPNIVNSLQNQPFYNIGQNSPMANSPGPNIVNSLQDQPFYNIGQHSPLANSFVNSLQNHPFYNIGQNSPLANSPSPNFVNSLQDHPFYNIGQNSPIANSPLPNFDYSIQDQPSYIGQNSPIANSQLQNFDDSIQDHPFNVVQKSPIANSPLPNFDNSIQDHPFNVGQNSPIANSPLTNVVNSIQNNPFYNIGQANDVWPDTSLQSVSDTRSEPESKRNE